MSEGLCVGHGCSSGKPILIVSRGLCSPCYQRLKRSDAFASTRDTSRYHRLTRIDAEAKTAICSICGPTTAFRGGLRNAKRGDDHRWRCAVAQKRVREWYLKRDYDLSPEQYRTMHRAQDGRCAICRKPETGGRDLAVDHCHDTGRTRGLLCWQCNTAIGKLGDTAGALRAALAYLEAAEQVS